MAKTLNVTTNFWGDVVDELFSLAVMGNDLVDGGYLYVADGIERKLAVPKITMSDIIQPPAATPTSKGSFAHTEDEIDPDDFLVYIEFDPNDYRQIWDTFRSKGEFLFTTLNPKVQAALLKELMTGNNGLEQYMGLALWQGDKSLAVTNVLSRFDGFRKKALANANVIDVTGYATLDATNIIAKMDSVYLQSREATRLNPNWTLAMNPASFELWGKANRDMQYKGPDWTQEAPRTFRGKEIAVLTGIADNEMYGTFLDSTRGSNFWMGTRGFKDFRAIQVEKLQANSDLWFFKLKMSADTYIKFGEDLAYYHA